MLRRYDHLINIPTPIRIDIIGNILVKFNGIALLNRSGAIYSAIVICPGYLKPISLLIQDRLLIKVFPHTAAGHF